MIGRPPTPLVDRLLAKVELPSEPSGCWLWTGSLRGGYGQIRVKSEAGWTVVGAHRAAYELFVGPIPDGLDLDHLCRNTKCVNPEHLEAVTRKVNVLRGVGPAAMNARKTGCAQGHPFEGRHSDGSRRCLVCEPVAAAPGTCDQCGEQNPPTRRGSARRFCSDRCRIRFHNERRAAA